MLPCHNCWQGAAAVHGLPFNGFVPLVNAHPEASVEFCPAVKVGVATLTSDWFSVYVDVFTI